MTDLTTPVHNSVEKPDLKPNCMSDVLKQVGYLSNIHFSKTLLRFGASAIGL